jgi:hypothetical protein
MTSVHNIFMRLIHTFVLTDLLLLTLLAAIAIMPLGLLASGRRGDRGRLPRFGPGPRDVTARAPLLGDGVLGGAGAGATS